MKGRRDNGEKELVLEKHSRSGKQKYPWFFRRTESQRGSTNSQGTGR